MPFFSYSRASCFWSARRSTWRQRLQILLAARWQNRVAQLRLRFLSKARQVAESPTTRPGEIAPGQQQAQKAGAARVAQPEDQALGAGSGQSAVGKGQTGIAVAVFARQRYRLLAQRFFRAAEIRAYQRARRHRNAEICARSNRATSRHQIIIAGAALGRRPQQG